MKRILVTGASGLLGANMVLEACERYEVISQYFKHSIHAEGFESIRADLSQPGAAKRLIEWAKPDWVIHCAAATNVDYCELNPEQAFLLNRDMAGWVAEAAWSAGARLVHISTDAVFDGQRGGYREVDPANPINVYGRSKLAGEEAVLAAHPKAIVVRTNIYGWNAQQKKSLAEWFLDHLEQGQSAPGFKDVWITPILVNDLADVLFLMLEAGLSGIYHVGGRECLSKYQFGRYIGRVFGLDTSLVRPVSVRDVGLKAARSPRLCLRNEKVEQSIGQQMQNVDKGIERFWELREKNDFYSRLKAMAQDGKVNAGSR